jgi:hypothetical protein
MREALLAAVAACLLFSGPASAQGLRDMIPRDPARESVQPGMFVAVADSSCTGGFIVNGTGMQTGRYYMTIAAHCTEANIGAPAADEAGRVFGHVAFSGWPYTTYKDDYAFIEIDQAAYPRVDPGMAGHPDMPTGLLAADLGAPGDRVQFSGWGFVTESKTETREQRPAFLYTHDEHYWSAEGPVSNTDSGGPVAHVPTGAAMGSVSNYCVPLPVAQSGGFTPGCTAWGPSMAGIITAAAAKGFTVEIRTAKEGAPKIPPPVVQPPATEPPSQAGPPKPASSRPPSKKAKSNKQAKSRKQACKTRKQRRSKRCKRRR